MESSLHAMTPCAPAHLDRSGPTVVRTAELQLLQTLVREPGRAGRLIAVVGEPGSGKTHLLAALVRDRYRGERPATVYRFTPGHDQDPHSPLHPALTPPPAPGAPDLPAGNVSRLRPGSASRDLLVLEDAHLANVATIRELTAIAAGKIRPRWDVVVSLRPRQTPMELAEAIALGVTFGHSSRIDLAPLTDEQVVALLSRPLTQEIRHGDRNPFNLRALQALEQSRRHHRDTIVAPFERAALSETQGLGAQEHRVLQAAVVLREHFDVELLSAVAELDHAQVSAAVRALVRRDLLRPDGVGRGFSVRHDVFGALLHRAMDPIWAENAHRRAIGSLASRGLTSRELGFHLVHSLFRARPEELAQLVAAAWDVMESDVSESLSWLTTVTEWTSPTSAIGRQARLALVAALGISGRMTESRDLLFDIHRHQEDLHEAGWADQVAFVCVVEGIASHDVQTLGLLGEQLDLPAARSSIAWPRMVFAHGLRLAMRVGTYDRQLLDAAVEVARHNGADADICGLLAIRALASMQAGDFDAAHTDASAAGEALSRCPERLVSQRLEYVFAVGLANLYLGRWSDARHQLRRGVATASRSQRTFILPGLLVMLSEAERSLGLLRQARESAQAAHHEAGSSCTLRWPQALALQSLSEVWLQPPGSGRARALAKQALSGYPLESQVPVRGDINGSASMAVLSLAISAWLDGDSQHCVTLLLNEGKGPQLTGLPLLQRGRGWELLCAAGLDAGLPIAEWAARNERHARAVSLPFHHAYALLSRGHVLRGTGRTADAAGCYLEAAALFASASMPIDQCYSLGLAAAALRSLGRATQAADLANLAAEIAGRRGALTLLHWLGRQDGRPGRPQPRDPAEPEILGALTRREREIAFLISSGMKRREIAERLTISIRTVDVHLTRIYRKTGLSSMVELAVAVNRTTGGQHRNHDPDRTARATVRM
ncbi:LuxR family transcriptional regulator [Frankia sp. QA3]|uniref:helix-turn-helix transcriptional regulator n=1 Tax=Frankia sp. QA3 TaxID=710111 RepID=UPI000269C188|nr:LuxR C-terminal-related transcriptional regulator [Frankia sp. QA3]EIV92558.1 response regulator containing a CheY-like receiver domain and an HTH DNA-binding domain [Frankia sp. QA3]